MNLQYSVTAIEFQAQYRFAKICIHGDTDMATEELGIPVIDITLPIGHNGPQDIGELQKQVLELAHALLNESALAQWMSAQA